MDIYDKIDLPLKTNLFVDTLNIVGIIPFSRKSFMSLDKIYNFENTIDHFINNAFCEINRPKGDYELIFPIKNNIYKYKKYFLNITEENKKFWEKIMKN